MSGQHDPTAGPSEPRDVPFNGGQHRASEDSWDRAASTARLGSPVPSQAIATPPVRQIPTPNQLQNEDLSNDAKPLPGMSNGAQHANSSPGESALAQALRGSFHGSPPRFDRLPARSLSPGNGAEDPSSHGNDGSADPWSNETDAPEANDGPYEDPEIVRRHLVMPSNTSLNEEESRRGSGQRSRNTSQPPGKVNDEFSSLQLQGGDITRQVYRWAERAEAEAKGEGKKRSKSFLIERPRPQEETMDIGSIKQPGGFRRDYLRRAEPSPSPVRRANGGPGEAGRGPRQPPQPVFTSNFIEFLSLYGHFAGETLDEDDEDLGPDEYFSSDAYEDSNGDEGDAARTVGEETPLLTPGRRKRRRKERAAGKGGALGAAMLLVKSFVGTGVLFLPRAFLNGGMLFSLLVLLFVSSLSYYCFLLLISTKLKAELSFGDMGNHYYGPRFRSLINFSLVISQMGFASAYIVFTSENLQAFVLAVTHCRTYIDIKYMILLQLVIFLPMSLYRNINKIQKVALVADFFILLGIFYLWYYDIYTLAAQHGLSDIASFNRNNWTLFIGTAIFTFEGVGLILPIQEGMKNPSKFPRVLGLVMVGITVVFVTSGAMSYAAFGSKTQTVVLLNMAQNNKFVNGIQFIYSVAILLSTPLQIYPAIEITSQQLFSRTGKYNPYIKWKKNFFRFIMVMLCALIAWLGANNLDKFVALVGSFACVPLVYIYPVSCRLLAPGHLNPYVIQANTNSDLLATLALQSCISNPCAQGRGPCTCDIWPCRNGLHHHHHSDFLALQ